jgi:hypothetical protein
MVRSRELCWEFTSCVLGPVRRYVCVCCAHICRAGLNLPGGEYGIAVYNAILAAAKRGVYVRFVVVRLLCGSPGFRRVSVVCPVFSAVVARQNIPTPSNPQTDVFSLVAAGAVDAQFINFTQLSGMNGVLHTKFMIADHSGPCLLLLLSFPPSIVTMVIWKRNVLCAAMYVGSANMDWRSLAHVRVPWRLTCLPLPSAVLLCR